MIIVIVLVLCMFQLIGEILEFKGKVVPEFMKIRKYFARKKEERENVPRMTAAFNTMTQQLKKTEKLISDFESHYSPEKIAERNNWMGGVNEKFEENDEWRKEISEMLKKNNEDTLQLRIESMRREIINFASYISDDAKPVTREQFNRIFNVHSKYEKIIEENGIENGEVDIAYRIINESYAKHLKEHTFIEDVRGY